MRTSEMKTTFPVGTKVTKRAGGREIVTGDDGRLHSVAKLRTYTVVGYGANGCLLTTSDDTGRKAVVYTDDVIR